MDVKKTGVNGPIRWTTREFLLIGNVRGPAKMC